MNRIDNTPNPTAALPELLSTSELWQETHDALSEPRPDLARCRSLLDELVTRSDAVDALCEPESYLIPRDGGRLVKDLVRTYNERVSLAGRGSKVLDEYEALCAQERQP